MDPSRPDTAAIDRAARVIRDGGLVAFPTETVYGLGANALDEAAVARVYEAKGRPRENPLIVHVASADAAGALTPAWPEAAERLAAAFWPGPLTLVLPRGDQIPALVSAGLPTVALRVPQHPVALALLRAAAVPVVAPSANPSTAVSPTRAEHVARGLGERVDLILDGGPTRVGIESTVVDLTGPRPAVLRPGAISVDELEAVVGAVERPAGGAPGAAGAAGAGPRPSPGMMERHYAPRARLELVPAGGLAELLRRAEAAAEGGVVVGALVRRDPPSGTPVAQLVRMPGDAKGYARELYAALHRLDEAGCGLILVEAPPEGAEWAGVSDRLRRAAAP